MNDEFEEIEQRYDNLLERIVKGAEFLDNPLIKPDVYEAGLQKYDRLCDELMDVKRRYHDQITWRGHERGSEKQSEA